MYEPLILECVAHAEERPLSMHAVALACLAGAAEKKWLPEWESISLRMSERQVFSGKAQGNEPLLEAALQVPEAQEYRVAHAVAHRVLRRQDTAAKAPAVSSSIAQQALSRMGIYAPHEK